MLQALITTTEQSTILDGLVLYERPSVEVIDKLIQSDLLQQDQKW